jgi:hypothetical protein
MAQTRKPAPCSFWIPGSREDARPGMTVWMDARVKPAHDDATEMLN